MRKGFFLVTSLLLMVLNVLAAPPEVNLESLDAYYEQALKDWNLPGMAIGIVYDGELVFSK